MFTWRGFSAAAEAMTTHHHSRIDDTAPFPWQSKKRLARTKKILHLWTGFYISLLLLLCISDRWALALILEMVAIGVGLNACGSGAAKVRRLIL